MRLRLQRVVVQKTRLSGRRKFQKKGYWTKQRNEKNEGKKMGEGKEKGQKGGQRMRWSGWGRERNKSKTEKKESTTGVKVRKERRKYV